MKHKCKKCKIKWYGWNCITKKGTVHVHVADVKKTAVYSLSAESHDKKIKHHMLLSREAFAKIFQCMNFLMQDEIKNNKYTIQEFCELADITQDCNRKEIIT